jgi:murein DD-endopeptidase MepM/ murein hydrolase activator NlpD
MTCRQIRRLLSVRREWTAQEQSVVEIHLEVCPACQAVAREYKLMDRRLGRLPEPAVAVALPSTVRARMIEERTMKSRPISWRRQAIQGLALAAVVALVVITALVWQGWPLFPVRESAMAPATSPKATPTTDREPLNFLWPVAGTLTQTYWPGHKAVDVANRVGTPVYAAADGIVAQVGRDDEYGNFILLEHSEDYETLYCHLRAIYAQAREPVSRGQQIGEIGTTGKTTGPHLHFEVRRDGEHLSPLEVVPEEARTGLLTSSLAPEAGSLQVKTEGLKLSWPTEGYISQTYWSGHQALDIASQAGTPVRAAADGVVTLSDQDEDRHGIHLQIDHGDGYTTFYSHLSVAHVEAGEQVERGQKIGAVGSTGLATGPHLHFEVRKDGEALNPFGLMVTEVTREEQASMLRIYGVQVHMLDQDHEPIIGAIQELGFGWVKQQVNWADIEPQPGEFRWDEVDRMVESINEAGLNLLLTVVDSPRWTWPAGVEYEVMGPPADPADLASFVGTLAARYRGRVGAYEIWQEQNMSYAWGGSGRIDAKGYVDVLQAAYEAIKAADPQAQVISGGLLNTPDLTLDSHFVSVERYLAEMYDAGLAGACDAVGAHLPTYNLPPDADWERYEDPSALFRAPFEPRDAMWSFLGTAEAYRRVMAARGDTLPVWITEFGWAVSDDPPKYWEFAGDNTPQEQAEFTLRAFEMAREWGWVEAMFLWNLNVSVVAPGSEKAMWSIVGPEWERTATFEALAEMEKR